MNALSVLFGKKSVRLSFVIVTALLAVAISYVFSWKGMLVLVDSKYEHLMRLNEKIIHENYHIVHYLSDHLSRMKKESQQKLIVAEMTVSSSNFMVIQHIDNVARMTKIRRHNIRWLGEKRFPLYVERTFELILSGDFSALHSFFLSLAEDPMLLSFSYSKWSKSQSAIGLITVTATGHSYQWIDGEEK